MEDNQKQGQNLLAWVALEWPSVPAPILSLCKGWSYLLELTALILVGVLTLPQNFCVGFSMSPRSPGPSGDP